MLLQWFLVILNLLCWNTAIFFFLYIYLFVSLSYFVYLFIYSFIYSLLSLLFIQTVNSSLQYVVSLFPSNWLQIWMIGIDKEVYSYHSYFHSVHVKALLQYWSVHIKVSPIPDPGPSIHMWQHCHLPSLDSIIFPQSDLFTPLIIVTVLVKSLISVLSAYLFGAKDQRLVLITLLFLLCALL